MEGIIDSVYMLCSILFIFSLSGLSNQETARKGNTYGVISMALAIITTFFLEDFGTNYHFFVPGFLLGGLIGLVLALRVEMINMPQMVAILHSFVGLAATLVGYSRYLAIMEDPDKTVTSLEKIETYIGVFMGAVTFTGSVIAWGKLQAVIRSQPLLICGWGRHVLNILCITGTVILGYLFVVADDGLLYLGEMTVIALFLGWHLVMAIGGADMPVVVSMLNSYSGWTTSASGFLLENKLLIITGALVGSSGAILSYIMCKAMNRSFFSVIMGGFGQGTDSAAAAQAVEGEQVEISCPNLVNELLKAKSVVIVPGYGMAVAKAQHLVGQFAATMMKLGKKMRFCIHPVAGRLPGHMNVLLAEANVPYNIVLEMDEINKDFPDTDVVLVIGANDIVNPDAQDNPNSLIAGMPVCEVWKAKRVVAFKRGRGTGYAGIENPLFFKPNTRMYFNSADKSMTEILNQITEVKGDIGSSKAAAAQPEEEVKAEDSFDENEQFPAPGMTIGVPREVYKNERRIAMTPRLVRRFRRLGFAVQVEAGAGEGAGYSDEEFTYAGAQVVSTHEVWSNSQILLKVRKPMFNPVLENNEHEYLANTRLLVAYMHPAQDVEFVNALADQYPQLTVFAMDQVPRITRAQKLDSLSSMANIAGYRAVVEAFAAFQKCPKAQITAAGKLPPAQVFIIGCGVAGLAAIGYCKNMGAIVKAFDTRPAAREQAESLGAEFIEIQAQEDGSGVGGYAREMSDAYKRAQDEMTRKIASQADIIITTALIPGKPAPKLVKEDAVRAMRPGSVIVDMAAEMGGNCVFTQPEQLYVEPESRVTIIGFTDLVSRMAPQSSELYSTNLWHLMDELGGGLKYNINPDDEIVRNMMVCHKGRMTWVPIEQRQQAPAPSAAPASAAPAVVQPMFAAEEEVQVEEGCCRRYDHWFTSLLLGAIFVGVGISDNMSFVEFFAIFVLAICIGYMVIWNVTPALHTPLMSVTNAISGIIVIGAMLELSPAAGSDMFIDHVNGLGIASLFFASINVVGGFVVTKRMLQMFHRG